MATLSPALLFLLTACTGDKPEESSAPDDTTADNGGESGAESGGESGESSGDTKGETGGESKGETGGDTGGETGGETAGETDDSGETGSPGDADGDGWPEELDCDDHDSTVHPNAEEPCDGVDNDCDGATDEAGTDIYYTDADGDGFGDPDTTTVGCYPGAGYATQAGDCDDGAAAVNPDAPEVCDGADNDCDGDTDEDGAPPTWYRDSDGDGYGNPDVTQVDCSPPSGYVANGLDCDDARGDVNPGESEVCDARDNDCDGSVDESAVDATEYWTDRDADGYGDPTTASTYGCSLGSGYAANDLDCDDYTASVNPAAEDVCNGVDDDCDGTVDPTTTSSTFYRDEDGDGYGDPANSVTAAACEIPEGYTVDNTDCDDTDPGVYPTAPDVSGDGIDSDCDGLSEYDFDGDGYDGEAYGGDDCNDSNATVYPGAVDTPYDGVDTDCSGGSDYDADGDGFVDVGHGGDDCDDTDPATYPGAPETDGVVDRDCDGVAELGPWTDADYDANSSTLESCATLQLDGSGSYDPDGATLSYAWTVDTHPVGSIVTTSALEEATDESPSVFVDLAGDYSFSLLVEDADGNRSAVDTLDLTIASRASNHTPTASAGADQTVSDTSTCTPISYSATDFRCPPCGSQTVTLDGGSSTDADGEPIQYRWSVYSGAGSISGSSTSRSVTVNVRGDVEPSYGATASNAIVVRLEVTDCFGATSAPDPVTITVECTGQ